MHLLKTVPFWVMVYLGPLVLAIPDGVKGRVITIFQAMPSDAVQNSHIDSSSVITYAPFTIGGRTQYCGETAVMPDPDYSNFAPLVADCAALADEIDAVEGYFTLSPSSFDTDNGWAPVARVGTCTFVVQFTKDEGITGLSIGTDDIRFQTRSVLYLAKDGRLGLQGDVVCYNGQTNKGVSWGLRKTGENMKPS